MNELDDWQCPNCGMVSQGSYAENGIEYPREKCRFCQARKPNLTNWKFDTKDQFWYEQ